MFGFNQKLLATTILLLTYCTSSGQLLPPGGGPNYPGALAGGMPPGGTYDLLTIGGGVILHSLDNGNFLPPAPGDNIVAESTVSGSFGPGTMFDVAEFRTDLSLTKTGATVYYMSVDHIIPEGTSFSQTDSYSEAFAPFSVYGSTTSINEIGGYGPGGAPLVAALHVHTLP